MKTLTSEEALNSNFNKPNPQDCPYCSKTCKNINSYKQHICRCKNNPNRIESTKRDYKAQYANLSQESKDKMAWNFDKNNLIVFETNQDHKRYHNSKYAKLIYNQEKHLFSCYIDK